MVLKARTTARLRRTGKERDQHVHSRSSCCLVVGLVDLMRLSSVMNPRIASDSQPDSGLPRVGKMGVNHHSSHRVHSQEHRESTLVDG